MLTFSCSKIVPLGIVNLKCIASAPMFRLFSLHQHELWKCTRTCKVPITVRAPQKFYCVVTLPPLQQLKDDRSILFHEDPKRTNIRQDLNKIEDVFDCTPEEANLMFKECPAIRHFTAKAALERIAYLETLGIHNATIRKYPWLLTIKPNELLSKFEALDCLKNEDVNDIVPILQASLDHLQLINSMETKDRIPNGSRITYLAEHLNCPVSEVCKFVLKFDFVYHIAFQRVKEVLQALIEAGVASEYILADGWILRYKVDMIKERIEEMKNAGVKVIKPWMLRSSRKNYKSTLRRAEASLTVLGEETVPDYLARRLECSKEYVKYLEQKNPKAVKVNIVKMHEIFNILFEEGFTPHQIAIYLRVLENSAETIRERLAQLKRRGIHPHSPVMLVKSGKEFDAFLKKIDKYKKM